MAQKMPASVQNCINLNNVGIELNWLSFVDWFKKFKVPAKYKVWGESRTYYCFYFGLLILDSPRICMKTNKKTPKYTTRAMRAGKNTGSDVSFLYIFLVLLPLFSAYFAYILD